MIPPKGRIYEFSFPSLNSRNLVKIVGKNKKGTRIKEIKLRGEEVFYAISFTVDPEWYFNGFLPSNITPTEFNNLYKCQK